MSIIQIFADGACRNNQHDNATGGYGVVILDGTHRVELAQGYRDTTNNRMELRAVVAALKALEPNSNVAVYTDSQYVCNAFNKGWIRNWIANGWKNANKKPVKNRDLWEELLAVSNQHEISWNWVKGHSGHPENERADQLESAAQLSDLYHGQFWSGKWQCCLFDGLLFGQ